MELPTARHPDIWLQNRKNHYGYLPADAIDPATISNLMQSNHQTASYQLVLADEGKVVEMDVATSNTLTIPTNGTVAFQVGTVIEVLQYGGGQTTITPALGVTLLSPEDRIKTAVRYASVTLRYRGSDEWVLEGDLA